jgi:hypothetical protein
MVIETSVAFISLLDGDILRIEFKPDVFVEPGDMAENMEAYRKLVGDKKVYLLTIAPATSTLSPEARDLFASPGRSSFKLAEGFVISSLAHRIMANFISKVQKPKHPLRFFDSEEAAMKWLKEIKAKVQ